ncbi:phage/plasmid primase, P4 family [Thermodesulfobacteriota bacterium]
MLRNGGSPKRTEAKPIGEHIGKGKRNATLASLAGTLRRRGASESTILTALLEENCQRCSPPLDEKEVAEIAKSVSRYEPDESSTPSTGLKETDFHRTDSGNAELFAALNRDLLRYDHRRKRWLLWGEHWWISDPTEQIVQLAKEAALTRQRLSLEIGSQKDKESAMQWAFGNESKARIDNTIKLARSEPSLADKGTDWDLDPWLMGVGNGVVDLRTGDIRDGQPEERITLYTDTLFDSEAPCPRWLQFLDEIFGGDPDLIDFIHRAAGYSLTGDISEQCLFFCYGKGANGKSVFLKTLRHVLGPYAKDTAFTTFEMRNKSSIPNDLAALAGSRFVTSSETNEGTRLHEARIKAMTGGDPVTARFLHNEYFTYFPTFKILLAVNHKPLVRDDSYGFWRRVRLIPFEQKFEGESDDKRLDEKLLDEAPGILAWAVRGCLEWQRRGLESPESVKSATEAYQAESDPLADFLDERCVLGPEYKAQASLLFSAYQSWCDEYHLRDRDRLNHIAFGERMTAKFFKKKDRGKWMYHGIGIAGE